MAQALGAIGRVPDAAGNAKGGLGFTGISAASAGLQAVSSTYNAVFQTISASLSLGASTSTQKASSSASIASPSTALAGRDLTAITGRDITIEGGRVQAGRDITLDAGRDLNIVAATNTNEFEQTAPSSSGGISLSVGFGASGMAASGSVSASASGSNNSGSGTSYTNALVAAGNNLSTSSDRDTNIKGAHVQGNTMDMTVGRDLNVHSLQDQAQNSGNSWSLGGSIGFDITGGLPDKIAGIPVHGSNGSSLNLGGGTSTGSTAWVSGQTSITAKEGLNIYTEKNTDIKGAVIAADNGNLLLNTGSLSHSNIQDKNKSESVSAGIAIGGLMENFVTSLDYAKSHQEQVNRATVGDGLVVIRDGSSASLLTLNRDTGLAQEVTRDDQVRMGVFFDSNLASSATWKAAWTGVNTILGTGYGLLGGILGDAQAEHRDGAIVFENHPFGALVQLSRLGRLLFFSKAQHLVILLTDTTLLILCT